MRLFALRGATSVESNTAAHILASTSELMDRNELEPEAMVSCIFTATEDLDAEFPALAARQLGLTSVPLLCTREIPVPGSLGRCIRILLHWNTDRPAKDVRHVFLRGARTLRPNWARRVEGDDAEESVRLPSGSP